MKHTDPRPVIAHVLHRLYLAGAEILAADLARKLSDRYRFVFLCLDALGPLEQPMRDLGCAVVNLQRAPGIDLSVARRMARVLREQNVGLVHAHQYTPFFYAAASRLPPSRWSLQGPPILFTEHGRHYPDFRRPKRILANRCLLLRRADRVTAVGHFVKRMLVENEGIADARIDVIHNGIDPAPFTAGHPAAMRQEVRAELGLPPDAPVMLQVARFHPVKDHVTAVRAMAHLRDALGPVPASHAPVLLLAGDGEKRGEIEQLSRSLSLGDAVRFIGVRQDVPRLMAAADVFVLSSLSEGISVTLLEAMAASLPIAATDVGGNSEVVAHDLTGLLSPRQDHAALGAHLLRLLRDPPLRQAMGSAGRQRLLDHFTQQRMHAQFIDLYERMLPAAR